MVADGSIALTDLAPIAPLLLDSTERQLLVASALPPGAAEAAPRPLRVVAIEHIEMLDREEDADVAYLEGKLPIDLDKVPDLSKPRTEEGAPAILEATES